jgi:hypothetical protein
VELLWEIKRYHLEVDEKVGCDYHSTKVDGAEKRREPSVLDATVVEAGNLAISPRRGKPIHRSRLT